MSANDEFAPVVESVDLLLAELSQIRSTRCRFRVIHRFRIPGTDCLPGEEILAILLVHRGLEYQLPLSPALLLLSDYLLRHSRFAQTASQIAAGIHVGEFYAEHGRNGHRTRIRRIPRSAIKEYMKRLRRALAEALGRARLPLNARDVLVTEESVSNQVLYRWKAVVELVNFDSMATRFRPIGRGNESVEMLFPILSHGSVRDT